MKQWLLKDGATTPEGLVEVQTTVPTPGAGEVLVRMHAVSLNYRDQLVLENAHNGWRLPGDLVPLSDGAGEVKEVGYGVSDWQVGDRVTNLYRRNYLNWPPGPDAGMGPGALGEGGVLTDYAIFPADQLVRAPAHLDFVEASVLPCAGVTAWAGLHATAPLSAGQKVLVCGTGGVALFALQLARAAGAEVYATSSRSNIAERLAALGVIKLFDYKADANWGQSVFAATGGVDRVINTAGFGSINQCVAALTTGGVIAQIGLMNFGDAIHPGPFLGKSATIRGIGVGSREDHRALVDFMEKHDVHPVIDTVFPFTDARRAYEVLAAGTAFGKLAINIAD